MQTIYSNGYRAKIQNKVLTLRTSVRRALQRVNRIRRPPQLAHVRQIIARRLRVLSRYFSGGLKWDRTMQLGGAGHISRSPDRDTACAGPPLRGLHATFVAGPNKHLPHELHRRYDNPMKAPQMYRVCRVKPHRSLQIKPKEAHPSANSHVHVTPKSLDSNIMHRADPPMGRARGTLIGRLDRVPHPTPEGHQTVLPPEIGDQLVRGPTLTGSGGEEGPNGYSATVRHWF
mmetsp:Transcript_31131/g.77471  ORF Transcript_31131/g.77471 Transcript_31131/m.77471 type:complete len:230 (-) Transcript_31131:541-1230(-)